MFLPCEHNPFQSVDRRWLRSNYLASQRRLRWHKSDDYWVRVGVQYLRALGRCRTECQRRRLGDKMPAMYLAHGLHQVDPPLFRWAVEARLLANEPFPDIARKCSITPEAVECYEALFFSVLDKLESMDYITCQVIGRKIHHGLSGDDLDVIWKFYGYHGGPILLDNVIDGVIPQCKPESREHIDSFLAQEARTTLLRKLAIAAHVLPVTPDTAPFILAVLAPLLTAEPRSEPAPTTTGVIRIDAQTVLEGLRSLVQEDGKAVNSGNTSHLHSGVRLNSADAKGGQEKDVDQHLVVPEPIRRRVGVLPRMGEPVMG